MHLGGTRLGRILRDYGVALLAVAGALVVRWLLDPILGIMQPLASTYAAVALAVWYGGVGPGLVAMVVAFIAGDLLFIEPRRIAPINPLRMSVGTLLYMTSCLIIIAFGAGMRSARRRYEAAVLQVQESQRLLEKEVAERATTQTLADQALRQSEARKSAILNTALDAIITMDHEGNVLEFNPAAERMFDYPREEVLGQKLAALIVPPALRDAHRQGLVQYLSSGESGVLGRRLELTAQRADGREFPVEVAITRLAQEGPPLFTGHIRDITERKRAERQLAVQHAVTRALAESVNLEEAAPKIVQATCNALGWNVGAVWLVDTAASRLRCVDFWTQPGVRVPEFEAMTRGYVFEPGKGLPGRVWQSGQPTWIADVVQDANFPRAHVAAQEGLHGAFGFPIVLEGEVLGMVEFFSREIQRPDQDLLQMIASAGGQIGQFIRRKRAEQALRTATEHLQLVTDVMSAPVTRCSRDLTYLWVSKPYADWLGKRPEDVIGRPIVEIVGREAFERLRPEFERVLSGQVVSYEERLAFQGIGPRWIHATYTPTLDAQGVPDGWVAVVLDINERKRSEEALKEEDRRKDEFLATLAHELRNPLAPITNALHLLRVHGPQGGEVQWARDVIDRQVRLLIRLVDDLLDLSRISRGKIELRRERVALSSIMMGALETSRPLIEANGLDLAVKLPAEPLFVQGDVTRLAQVLANLLNNAAKYTPRGGRIFLTAVRQGAEAVVGVRDTGVGIPPEMLSRIFEMFTQVDRTLERTTGGLGIGLTLVRRLVEMHGGTVTAQSAGPGQGSEFLVHLPLAAEEEIKPRRGPAKSQAPSVAPRRILVVDDNRDAASSLATLLRLEGHQVTVAYDGAEAVEQAAALAPEVVLLDIGLPKMNGYDAARQIRAQPSGKDALLIACTGYGQEQDRQRSLEAGFDYHLTKPVDYPLLCRLLEGAAAPVS